MITIEKIDELLNVPIKCEDGRFIRIMSCDNILKKILLFHSHELKLNGNFENQLKTVILRFSEMVHYILENPENINRESLFGVNKFMVLPTKEIIQNSIFEIKDWYILLDDTLKDLSNLDFEIDNLSMINYIVIANFCGISDFSRGINSSRLLRRFINFQNQTASFYRHDISTKIFLEEIKNHKEYIETMTKIYKGLDLEPEDLLTFILLFDIRKNRNMFDRNRKT